ncbi:MAG: hypothetical protein IBX70_05170 [Clostridia bacterium]|nr:hypothetical protein [Clostridia bacterium]
MNKSIFGILVLLAFVLSGCSKDEFSIKEGYPPDQALSVYFPAEEFEFMGERGYYHYYKNLNVEDQSDRVILSISGEVKDISRNIGKRDHGFQVELWVDSEKMVQTISGQMLNESEFNRLILLKNPIQEDAIWVFDSLDKKGQKHTVTARIVVIDEEAETIEIEYTTKAGNHEKRIMAKNRGTISFVKQVTYKDALTYTGYYHIPAESAITNENDQEYKYNTLEAIEIDFEIYEIVDEFNKRWVNYIKNIDQSLMELIDMDSNAFLKIVAIKDEPIQLNDYLGFKPYKLEVVDDMTLVYVLEKFMVNNDEIYYNAICYEVIKMDEGLFISDFYLSNP